MKPYITIMLTILLTACGSDEITQSGADYYEEFGRAFCESTIEACNSGADLETCVDLFVQEACTSDLAACSMSYTVSADEWGACLDELHEQSCDALIAGIIPSECYTVEGLW